MGKNNNFPQAGIDDLEPDYVAEVVGSLWELHNLGRPDSDEELESRINEYFSFCQRTGNRPGIESLCLALHISRTTLFNWNAGLGCTKRRQELIMEAKSFIAAFLEQATMRGKISPPSGIFLLKNWLGYRDTVSFENVDENKAAKRGLPEMSAKEAMQMLREHRQQKKEMPRLEDFGLNEDD